MKLFIFLVLALCQLINGSILPDNQASPRACIVEITNAAQQGNDIAVSWTFSDCGNAIGYVSYSIEGGPFSDPVEEFFTGVGIITDVELSCQTVTIQVNAVENGEDMGVGTKESVPDFPSVTNVQVVSNAATLQLTWLYTDFAGCDVTFEVSYTLADTTVEDVCPSSSRASTTCNIDLGSLEPCDEIVISITPVVGVYRGDIYITQYKRGMGAAKTVNARAGANQEILVDIQPSDVIGKCADVWYRVIQDELVCYETEITVVTFTGTGDDELLGESIQSRINKGPGPVNNIEMRRSGADIEVEWEIPSGGETCSLTYRVTYEGETITTGITSHSFPAARESCEEHNVEVQAIVNALALGATASATLIEEIRAVDSPTCVLDAPTVTCTWGTPPTSDACTNLRYLIRYSDGTTVQTAETPDLTFSFQTSNCGVSYVVIEAVAEEIVGEAVDVDIDCGLKKF